MAAQRDCRDTMMIRAVQDGHHRVEKWHCKTRWQPRVGRQLIETAPTLWTKLNADALIMAIRQ